MARPPEGSLTRLRAPGSRGCPEPVPLAGPDRPQGAEEQGSEAQPVSHFESVSRPLCRRVWPTDCGGRRDPLARRPDGAAAGLSGSSCSNRPGPRPQDPRPGLDDPSPGPAARAPFPPRVSQQPRGRTWAPSGPRRGLRFRSHGPQALARPAGAWGRPPGGRPPGGRPHGFALLVHALGQPASLACLASRLAVFGRPVLLGWLCHRSVLTLQHGAA